MKYRRSFYQGWGKRIFDLAVTISALLLLWPIFLIVACAIWIDSEGPTIFKQKRIGKNGKVFLMYKFRTMVKNAEELKENFLKFNEADGPAFKIKDDPRFTKVGKFLARTGIDELPQLINVLKGEMGIVGPRPLPINEAQRIPSSFRKTRQALLPGMTSLWVVSGAHNLTFDKWMSLDREYSRKASFSQDFEILLGTVRIVVSSIFAYFL